MSSLAEEPILVAAAADLAPLQGDLEKAFSGRVRFTFGSSGMLARQIAAGAPYDVYLSANEQFVVDLIRSGAVAPDTVRTYASGRLGLWSKKGIRTLAGLDSAAVRHVAIANPAHAPYGVAAQQVLQSERLWERLRVKLVLGENVRQAFEYARTGNADATLTAWTLVHKAGGVLIPETLHRPIRQAGAVVRASRRQAEGRRLLEYLVSEAGQTMLEKHGLGRAPRSPSKKP
ncbi:MAG: molybdate ABC transporter substrate-binding protein [Bryobacteraceae bacterium]|nr:molybdate ABC transporter substrate-binding protein [Bryobacteraceae bacterium]